MQFRVEGTPAATYNVAALNTALPTAYASSQPAAHVPSDVYANNTLLSLVGATGALGNTPIRVKTIVEEFDLYGRMNALLGTEVTSLNNQGQNAFGFHYTAAPTEIIPENDTQIWAIVHNGVDTHPIHFHHVNVQIINRVDWAGVIKPPDPNEIGWKETVRMNPLETIIVAMKATRPTIPFTVPDSVRPLDVTMPVDTNPLSMTYNPITNFSWEYT